MAGVKLNGNPVSGCNTSVRLANILFPLIQSIGLKEKVSPVKIYGLGSPLPLARTDGNYDVEDSDLEMIQQHFDYFVSVLVRLGDGDPFGYQWDTNIQQSNRVDPMSKIVLESCRLVDIGTTYKAGSGESAPTICKGKISIMRVKRNGAYMRNFTSAFGGAGVSVGGAGLSVNVNF